MGCAGKFVDNALPTGYTVAWDGDVGEKGLSAGKIAR